MNVGRLQHLQERCLQIKRTKSIVMCKNQQIPAPDLKRQSKLKTLHLGSSAYATSQNGHHVNATTTKILLQDPFVDTLAQGPA